MNTIQNHNEIPDVQAAIYRVALSLDSFLMNGIPCGVIRQAYFNGFLQETAATLRTQLSDLETFIRQAPKDSQPKTREVLGALKGKCQELIDLVTELSSFRDLPQQQVHDGVSKIPLVRGQCVHLIQELEGFFQTPKPFYQTRPAHSTTAVNDFLANLDRLFTEEWQAAAVGPQGKP
jgi:hypothetical protein